jgi:ABC-type transporter Mla MlaB component
MYHGPRTILLAGSVDAGTVGELLDHSRREAEQGRRRLVIDMSAVRRCDHDGLAGLEELVEGWCGLPVQVINARWSQFLPALLAADVECLTAERERVRALVETHADHAEAVPAGRGS